MKSPNSHVAIKQLNIAIELIRNVYEDIKNDDQVRRLSIHTLLLRSNETLEAAVSDLDNIGYPAS